MNRPSSLIVALGTCSSQANQKWNFTDIVTLSTSSSPSLQPWVYLSGSWNTATKKMNFDLKTNNKIPLSQPYCISPWNYCGNESIANNSSLYSGTVDWVLVEVKNSSGVTVQRKAALLASDGLVYSSVYYTPSERYLIGLDNISSSGSYKIILRHRNHLAIATNTNITLAPNTVATIDFTLNTNVKAANQKSLGLDSYNYNSYGMRLGDVNSDNTINATDKTLVQNANDGIYYSNFDLNLDSMVNAGDRTLMDASPDAVANL
jgi:hypothetical protein